MSLTADTSRFIVETRIEDVPAEVLRLAKRSILDGLGLAVAGSRSTAAEIARREIETLRRAPRGRLRARHGATARRRGSRRS